jgi:hypothetical protein
VDEEWYLEDQYNPFNVDYGWMFDSPDFPWTMVPQLGGGSPEGTGNVISGAIDEGLADVANIDPVIPPYNVVANDTPTYSQQEIDDVMAQVNSGQITAEDLVLMYPDSGLTVEDIQGNIDTINNTAPYDAPTDSDIFDTGITGPTSNPYEVPNNPPPIFDENGTYNGQVGNDAPPENDNTNILTGIFGGIGGTTGSGTTPVGATGGRGTGGGTSVPGTDTSGGGASGPTTGSTGGGTTGGGGTGGTTGTGGGGTGGAGSGTGGGTTDTTTDTGGGMPDILDTILGAGGGAGGAASSVASAIGGAVNVNNQFDFLENSADDQMRANRQAALDSSTLMNPNYENPYGSQTTTPAYVDANGNLVQPKVVQALNPQQQGLFDTETEIKQGLGNTALSGISGVQSMFGTPMDTSGLIDRYQVDPSGIQDYSNIDLNALSARNTQPGVTGRNTITDAMIAREQPRFDRAEEQMRNKLLIQGFNPGTEGFAEQTDEFGRAKNDFNLAAQAAGAQEQSRLFGLESALRAQQLQEQDTARVGNAQNREQQVGEQMDFGRYTSDERARMLQEAMGLRNQPLNELNALRNGNQATVPQFQPFNANGVAAAPAYEAAQSQAQAAGNYADGFFGLGGEILDWFGNRTAQPAAGN